MKHPQKEDSWSYSYYNCDVKISKTVESSLWMSVVHKIFLLNSQKGFGFYRPVHSSQQHSKIQQNMTNSWHDIYLFYCEKALYYYLQYTIQQICYIKDSAIYTFLIAKG